MAFLFRSVTREISAEGLAALLERGQSPLIVDVREPSDYHSRHLPGAINIPLRELEARAAEFDPSAPLVFY